MSRQNVGFLLRALLIILVGAAPVISVVIASGFASTLGCKLDEGNPHPCPFHGVDLGDTLYSMFVAGSLGLITGSSRCDWTCDTACCMDHRDNDALAKADLDRIW